jgi:hypothetical protein
MDHCLVLAPFVTAVDFHLLLRVPVEDEFRFVDPKCFYLLLVR